MQIADYSAALLTGTQLPNAGFSGSCRYVGTPGRAKNTTPAELRSHKAAGLHVFGVYENTVNDWAGGFRGGVAAAHLILADPATREIPAQNALFVCADRHLSAAQCKLFRQYVLGARSVLGLRAGGYGFSEAIDAIKDLDVHLWQCGSRSAVRKETNMWQNNNTTRQVGGITVDINEVFTLPVAAAAAPARRPRKDELMTQYIACVGAIKGQPNATAGAYLQPNGDFVGLSAGSTAAMLKAAADPTNDMHVDWVTPGDWNAFDRESHRRRDALNAQVTLAGLVQQMIASQQKVDV